MLKQFDIQFGGISAGSHHFEFKIDNSFFESFDYTDFDSCDLSIDVMLEKQERMLIFDIAIHGNVAVPCDRCLDIVNIPVKSQQQLIVKLANSFLDEGDDIVCLPERESNFDLSNYIYEYVLLSLPTQRVHRIEECNKDMIKRIEELKEEKSNDTSIWADLKKIK